MTKVYLRADENGAGVTVEDSGPDVGNGPEDERVFTTLRTVADEIHVSDAEACAAVEGLLRRMWERDGWGLTNAWYQKALENWLKSKDMGRQGEGR